MKWAELNSPPLPFDCITKAGGWGELSIAELLYANWPTSPGLTKERTTPVNLLAGATAIRSKQSERRVTA